MNVHAIVQQLHGRLRAFLAASSVLAALSAAGPALAAQPPNLVEASKSPDPNTAADALYQLASLDDQSFDFAAALAEYEACAARSPSSRWAPRAVVRASTLRGHAEGGFAPFVRLERVRRDPALADDPATLDALAHDAEAFPPGAVRVEAEMLVAEAYRGRMGRPRDSIVLLRKIVADPKADVLTSRQAGRELVDTLMAEGELDEAARTATELGPRLDSKVGVRVRLRLRQQVAHRLALGDLSLLTLLVLASLGLAWRRGALASVPRALGRVVLVAVGFATYSAIMGSVLATNYESGNAAPFLGMGAAMLPIVLLSRAWSAAGSSSTAARVGRALLCATGIVAAAFLVLERIDPVYLEGFGL